jgi:electron transfer flavoprotein beta subunit
VAELMGLPQVSLAKKIGIKNDKVIVEKVAVDGYEVIEAATPALITVSNELGEPRYPTIKGIAAAAKKTPVIWKPGDIGLEVKQIGAAGRLTKMLKIYQPVHESRCEIVTGADDVEAGTNLAKRMAKAKLI